MIKIYYNRGLSIICKKKKSFKNLSIESKDRCKIIGLYIYVKCNLLIYGLRFDELEVEFM